MTPEQEKEIKLKGKCYLVYKDKVLEKQARTWNIRMTVMLTVATICTTLFPLFQAQYKWRSFLVLILLPIIAIYCCKGFGNRKGIRSDSLLNINRWRYRSTSEGDIKQERRFSPLMLLVTLMPPVGGIPTIILIILGWVGIKSPLSIIISVLLTISYLIELFSICAVGGKVVYRKASNFAKRIEYQEKTYFFNE